MFWRAWDLYRVLVVTATIAFGGSLVAWAFAAPAFRAPDEHVHFASVLRVEYRGGWPAPGEALVPPGVDAAFDEARLSTKLPRSEVHWGNPPVYFHLQAPPETFTAIDADNALPDETSFRVDQMTQHPPTAYAVLAGLSRLAGMPGEPWPVQLWFARLIDACLMLPLPWLIAATARRFGVGDAASGATAFFPLAIPQVSHIGSSVTSDALVILLAAVWSWLVVRTWQEGMSMAAAGWLGLAVGAAIITKGTALVLVPATLAFVVACHPRRGWWTAMARGAVSMAVAFVVGGWWYAANLVRYGEPIPSGLTLAASPNPDPSRSFGDFVATSSAMLIDSFAGRFSYLELTLSTTYARALAVGIVLCAVVALVVRRRDGAPIVTLLAVPALVVALAMVRNYDEYRDFGLFPGFQGRYLFIGLVGMALVVAVVMGLARGWWQRAVGGALVAVAGLVSAWGLLTGVRGFYQGRDETWGVVPDRWAEWTFGGAGGVATAVVAMTLAALAVAAAVAALAFARRAPVPEQIKDNA